ncbi:hypothetical protein J2X36_004277 [Methylobacterium sp. BE186]|nr:hypothetical protein [Methylobacterium sp. BE186]
MESSSFLTGWQPARRQQLAAGAKPLRAEIYGTDAAAQGFLKSTPERRERAQMGSPATTLFAAGAAFAGGVIATVAFVAVNTGDAPSAPPVQPVSRVASSSPADQPWADPVKTEGASSPSRQEPRSPLTFHVDGAQKQRPADHSTKAEAAASNDDQARPDRLDGGKADIARQAVRSGRDGAVATRSEPAKTDGARAPQIQAEILKADRKRADPAELGQVRKTEFRGVPERSRTNEARDRVARSQVPDTVEQRFSRAASSIHGVAASESRRESMAASKQARRIVSPPVSLHAEAPLDDESFKSSTGLRRRVPERVVREPSRRITSADAGGVMRWLMEP